MVGCAGFGSAEGLGSSAAKATETAQHKGKSRIFISDECEGNGYKLTMISVGRLRALQPSRRITVFLDPSRAHPISHAEEQIGRVHYGQISALQFTRQVVGLIGTVQFFEARRKTLGYLGSVGKATDFIPDHLGEGLMLSEIARHASLSERQLQRLFRRAFGMTIQQFIIRILPVVNPRSAT